MASIPGEAVDKALAAVIESTGAKATAGTVRAISDLYGGFIGDRLTEWRQTQAIRFAHKTVAELTRLGVDPKELAALPNGQLYSLFRNGIEEENDTLQLAWAKLLASFSAGDIDDDFRRALQQIATSIRPVDAAILSVIAEVYLYHQQYLTLMVEAGQISGTYSIAESDNTHHSRRRHQERILEDHRKRFAESVVDRIDLLDADVVRYSISHLQRLGIVYGDRLVLEDRTTSL